MITDRKAQVPAVPAIPDQPLRNNLVTMRAQRAAFAGSTAKLDRFPPRIRSLEPFSQRFEAFRLHDTDNCGVITKGEMVLIVAGVETRCAPGDWYHIPSPTVHAGRCVVDTEAIEFWFQAEEVAR